MKKDIIKKVVLTHLLQTIIGYTLVYLSISFIIWDFNNPIQWIIDIPTLKQEQRFCVLFFIVFYIVCSIVFWKDYYTKKQELSNLKKALDHETKK